MHTRECDEQAGASDLDEHIGVGSCSVAHSPAHTHPHIPHPPLFFYEQVNNGVSEVSSQCQLSALVDALKMYKATYKVQLESPAEGQK